MFNLWKRTYCQVFDGHVQFNSKMVMIDEEYAGVMFIDQQFYDGGELQHHYDSLGHMLSELYDGSMSAFLEALKANDNDRTAIVCSHATYYAILACYLKELQFSYKLTDGEVAELAFSFIYDNFYYSNDVRFRDGFTTGSFADVLNAMLADYEPIGILDDIAPVDLPTEIGYFLVMRGKLDESQIHDKFINAAKMIVKRLSDVHRNDFSEWMLLDTRHFLNMMKCESSPEVLTDTISQDDQMQFIQADPYLRAMFYTPFPFETTTRGWEDSAQFKVAASQIIGAWRKLANYLVERGLDAEWAKFRHSHYTEIILRHDYVTQHCDIVSHLLQLDNAPTQIEGRIIDNLSYDILSECMDARYNKTLMLFTLRGKSPTIQGFINNTFNIEEAV